MKTLSPFLYFPLFICFFLSFFSFLFPVHCSDQNHLSFVHQDDTAHSILATIITNKVQIQIENLLHLTIDTYPTITKMLKCARAFLFIHHANHTHIHKHARKQNKNILHKKYCYLRHSQVGFDMGNYCY